MSLLQAEQSSQRDSGINASLAGLLLLAAVVPYLNTLTNPFVFDDVPQIVENPHVQSFRYLPQIFGGSPWSFEGAQGFTNYYRPLMSLSFLLCYQAFGAVPFGFHMVNLLLHAANVLLVYFLVRQMFKGERVATVAALLFAVHPIHSEPVAFVAAVTDLQLTFFSLLTCLLYVRPVTSGARPGWPRQLGMAGSFSLALLAKEPAMAIPALAVFYEHFVREDRNATTPLRKVARYAPLWLVALGYLLLRTILFGGLSPALQRQGLTTWELVLSAVSLTGQYLGKLVWPVGLSAFRPFHKSESLFELQTLAGLAVLAACAAAFIWLWKRSRAAAFGLVWIFLPLAPVLNARWMPANVFGERYLYLPSVGFCWLVAWAGVRLYESLPRQSVGWRRGLTFILATITFLCALRVVVRNRDWRDSLTLYTDALRQFPEAHILRGNLGAIYWNQGNYAQAEQEWTLSMQFEPNNVITLQNLGTLYRHRKEYGRAIEMFTRTLQIRPEYTSARLGLGATYEELGDVGRALASYETAVAQAPLNVAARNSLGRLYVALGREQGAEEQLRRSLEIRPSSEAATLLGAMALLSNNTPRAEGLFRQALELEPFNSRARFHLAQICQRTGRTEEAAREYEAGLALDPTNSEAAAALTMLRQKAGARQP